jgi:hypothetical protein
MVMSDSDCDEGSPKGLPSSIPQSRIQIANPNPQSESQIQIPHPNPSSYSQFAVTVQSTQTLRSDPSSPSPPQA